jgi:energy-coupling factor transporter transmembrane protein EcfT
MTEPSRDYYDEIDRRGSIHREAAFEFDKLAAAYSQKGFETLTYLNGGALVALPAALAFFKADIPTRSIIAIAASFIIGLLLVVLAQVMAFFTMAKRSEAQEFRYNEQIHLVAGRQSDAQKSFATSESRRVGSNLFRRAGLVCFFLSLFAFIFGCSLGAMAVTAAKDKVEAVAPKPH